LSDKEEIDQTVRPVTRSLRGWSGEATDRSKPSDNVPTFARVAPKPFRGSSAETEKARRRGEKRQIFRSQDRHASSHELKDYVGDYTHPGYGTIKITQAAESFDFSLNKLGPFPLKHYHYNVFEIPEDAATTLAGEKVQFHMNKKGDIDSISAALEPSLEEDIVFTRAPEKIARVVLQSLAGEYVLNEMTVSVSLIGDSLRLTVPGQPQYELVSTKGLSFDVKGLIGFSVEFKKDASGKITEIVFRQPDGVFTAKRK
jgi:Domain of unknown function (DUF3471)